MKSRTLYTSSTCTVSVIAMVVASFLFGCMTPEERFAEAMARGAGGNESERARAAWFLLRGIGTEKNIPKGLSVLNVALAAGEPDASDFLNDWVRTVLENAELDDLPVAMLHLAEAYGRRHCKWYDNGKCIDLGVVQSKYMDRGIIVASANAVEAFLKRDDVGEAIAVRNRIREVSLSHNEAAGHLDFGGNGVVRESASFGDSLSECLPPGVNICQMGLSDVLVCRMGKASSLFVPDSRTGCNVPYFYRNVMDAVDAMIDGACQRIACQKLGIKFDSAVAISSAKVHGDVGGGISRKDETLENAEVRTVLAEGMGATLEEAKADALREAVSQVVGERFAGLAEVVNDELVVEQIETRSSGAIDGWGVASGPEITAEGLYRVVLNVRVRNRFLRPVASGDKTSKSVTIRKGSLGNQAFLHDTIVEIRDRAEQEAVDILLRWERSARQRVDAFSNRTLDSNDEKGHALQELRTLLGSAMQELVFCEVIKKGDDSPVRSVSEDGTVSLKIRIGVNRVKYDAWAIKVGRIVQSLACVDEAAVARLSIELPSGTRGASSYETLKTALGTASTSLFRETNFTRRAVVGLFDETGKEISRRTIPFDNKWIIAMSDAKYRIAPSYFSTGRGNYLYEAGNDKDFEIRFPSLSLEDVRRITSVRCWTEP